MANHVNELKEKYREKIAALDARMKELEAMEFNDEVNEEMISVMCMTNRYLRAIGAPEKEMYDL